MTIVQHIVSFFRSKEAIIFLTILILTLLGVFLIEGFVRSEHTVYFWDYSAYQKDVVMLSHWLMQDPIGAIRGILHSIRYDEYNLLFATPLVPAAWIFGTSRLSYELSVFVLYAVPASLLLAYLFSKAVSKVSAVSFKWTFLVTWILIIANPLFIVALLKGYPDIVGLIPISIALILYMRYRNKPRVRLFVSVASLLLLATFLRRWYIFAAAGSLLAIGIDQLQIKIRMKQEFGLVKLIARIGLLGIVYVGGFVIIAWPYVKKLLATNYGDAYAAYKTHNGYVDLGIQVVQHFGGILLLIAIAGLVLGLARLKNQRSLIGVIGVAAVFAFFAVGRVQSFDLHQYYLLILPFLFGIVLAVFLFAKNRPKYVLGAGVAIIIAVYGVSAYGIFTPASSIAFAFSQVNAQPDSRPDVDSLERLYRDVARQASSSDTLYVLACSNVLNADVFRNIPLYLTVGDSKVADQSIVATTELDVRDGFYTHFFMADVVLDSDPVGYITQNKQEQQIAPLLHNEIADGLLTKYYTKLPTIYSLEKGYTASLYVRSEMIPDTVREQVLQKVQATHKNLTIHE